MTEKMQKMDFDADRAARFHHLRRILNHATYPSAGFIVMGSP
jgi:hypothetical protein